MKERFILKKTETREYILNAFSELLVGEISIVRFYETITCKCYHLIPNMYTNTTNLGQCVTAKVFEEPYQDEQRLDIKWPLKPSSHLHLFLISVRCKEGQTLGSARGTQPTCWQRFCALAMTFTYRVLHRNLPWILISLWKWLNMSPYLKRPWDISQEKMF